MWWHASWWWGRRRWGWQVVNAGPGNRASEVSPRGLKTEFKGSGARPSVQHLVCSSAKKKKREAWPSSNTTSFRDERQGLCVHSLPPSVMNISLTSCLLCLLCLLTYYGFLGATQESKGIIKYQQFFLLFNLSFIYSLDLGTNLNITNHSDVSWSSFAAKTTRDHFFLPQRNHTKNFEVEGSRINVVFMFVILICNVLIQKCKCIYNILSIYFHTLINILPQTLPFLCKHCKFVWIVSSLCSQWTQIIKWQRNSISFVIAVSSNHHSGLRF